MSRRNHWMGILLWPWSKGLHAATRLWDLVALAGVRAKVDHLGSCCRVYGRPIITRQPGSSLRIGHRVVLCSRSENTALGVSRPVILRTLTAEASIKIGDDTGLSGTTICAATSVEIGPGCLIGADVMIVDTDFHPLAPEGRRYAQSGAGTAPIRIGSNVFLGARTMVLKGVVIGDNTVVGAGSVVSKDIPANVIAAGNPARALKIMEAPTGQVGGPSHPSASSNPAS